MVAKAVASRGLSLMKGITAKLLHMLKAEVDGMTPEEARAIWTQVEPFFPGVCTRASSRRRDTRWLELVGKMTFINNRAEEALENVLRGFPTWYKPEEVEDTVLEHVDDS